MTSQQSFPTPQTPIMDGKGNINRIWQKFFVSLWIRTGSANASDDYFAYCNGDAAKVFNAQTATTATEVPPLAQVQALDATVQSNAETFATNAASTAQSNAETFATNAASTAQSNAEMYALNQIQLGTGAAFSSLTAGASPYTFTAAAVGHLLVSAGTVSAITLNRGSASLPLPSVSGFIPLDNTDSVTITYSAAPTLNWIPR